jgi:hypothetical protein
MDGPNSTFGIMYDLLLFMARNYWQYPFLYLVPVEPGCAFVVGDPTVE